MEFKNNANRKKNLIVFLIRWWSVGAVYLFIGWGTGIGGYNSTIDIVIVLGIAIGLVFTFVVNPVLKMLYDMGDKRKYKDTSVMEKVSYRLRNILASIFIVYLVSLIYEIINRSAILILNLDAEKVFLPGEPILFAGFYMLVYTILAQLIKNVKTRSQK